MSPRIDRHGKVVDPYPPGEVWKEMTRDETGIPVSGMWERDYEEEERRRTERQRDHAERVAKQKEETARAAQESARERLAPLVVPLAEAVKEHLQASGDLAAGEELERLRREATFAADTRQRASGFGRKSGEERERDYKDWRKCAARFQAKHKARGFSKPLSVRELARRVKEELQLEDSPETIRKQLASN